MLQSGMAQSRRSEFPYASFTADTPDRDFELNVIRGKQYPVTKWIEQASAAILRGQTEQQRPYVDRASSPTHAAPSDEIRPFTPSSDHRSKEDRPSTASASSPTAHISQNAKEAVLGTSDAEDDDDDLVLPDLDEVMGAEMERARKEKELAARAKLLAERKAAALRLQQSREDDIDDDFEVVKETAKAVKFEEPRRGPDAKAILGIGNAAGPAPISKERQDLLKRAGMLARRKKEDATETFVDFAGKAFKHAEMKRENGGARPAGVKKGRDTALTGAQLDQMIRQKHLEQAAMLRKKKDEEWGQTRQLPEKRTTNIEELVQASSSHQEVEEQESEDEDGEFVPDGDIGDDEAESEVEGEGEDIQFSGEEDEGPDRSDEGEEEDDEREEESTAVSDTNKENRPEEDEEETIIRRKAKPTIRVAIDSDDEEITPRASRQPLAEIQQASPTAQKRATQNFDGFNFGGELNLGGFGEDSQSGGFSQLFEPTQVSHHQASVSSRRVTFDSDADDRTHLLVCAMMLCPT